MHKTNDNEISVDTESIDYSHSNNSSEITYNLSNDINQNYGGGISNYRKYIIVHFSILIYIVHLTCIIHHICSI